MNIIILNSDIERITPNGYFAIKGVRLPDGRYMLPDRVMTDEHLTDFIVDVQAVKEKDSEILDLPEIGEQCVKDVIYKLPSDLVDEELSDLVVCVQTHDRTIYNPKDTPALFSFFRENSDELEWIPNEWVEIGWKRVYEGTTYTVIQAHQTLETWTPDATPALWQAESGGGDEYEVWAAGVAYTTGDVVTYEGLEYECRQSHTSLTGWEPPNVLALWLPL